MPVTHRNWNQNPGLLLICSPKHPTQDWVEKASCHLPAQHWVLVGPQPPVSSPSGARGFSGDRQLPQTCGVASWKGFQPFSIPSGLGVVLSPTSFCGAPSHSSLSPSLSVLHASFQSDCSYDFLSAEEKECLLFLEETIGSLDTEADSGLSTDESEQDTAPRGPRALPVTQPAPQGKRDHLGWHR